MATDYTYDPRDDQSQEQSPTGLVKVQDTATGQTREISPFTNPDDTPLALRDSTFKGTGSKAVSKISEKFLRNPVDPKTEVDIRPSGEVYVSHVHIRRRLNDAFGPAGWALRPLGNVAYDPQRNDMYREWALIAGGRVVATAFGSARYQAKNARLDFADAAEALKSNALTRCAKDLGIASECWDRQWAEQWKNAHCVHVYVVEKKWNKNSRKEEPTQVDYWRRIDAKPFRGELEPVADSPNQEAWRKQATAWAALMESEIKKSQEVKERLRTARRGANEAIRETEAAVREARKQSVEPPPEEKRSQPASEPVQHARPNGDDRRYQIRECKIVKREPTYVLHMIKFMDGAEFFTFSTTTYAAFQSHFARRDMVDITGVESHLIAGKPYRHIVEWKVIRQGQLQS